MISVIVPVYNAASFLHETFDSLVNQTDREFEVIFVDDGSTDHSAALIGRFLVDQPHVNGELISQENRGSAAARNTGIKAARGSHLIFLDSDDLLETDRIERDRKRIADQEVDFYFGPVYIFKTLDSARLGDTQHERNKKAVADGDLLRASLLRNLYLPPCSATVTTERTQAIGGFREGVRFGEDFDFFLRYLHPELTFDYCDEPVAKYRFGHGSKSSRIFEKHGERMGHYLRFFESEMGHHYVDIQDRCLAECCLTTANDFYRFGKFVEFRDYLRKAREYDAGALRFKERRRLLISYLKSQR